MTPESRELYLLIRNDEQTSKKLLSYAQRDYKAGTKYFLGPFIAQIASYARTYERDHNAQCFTVDDIFTVATKIYQDYTTDYYP